MGGPVEVLEMVVGARTGIVVTNQKGNGGAGGPALEHPRQDFDPIGFISLGGESALAGTASV